MFSINGRIWKIEVETEELQPKEIIEDWVTYIKRGVQSAKIWLWR